jgi:hypothetical protein
VTKICGFLAIGYLPLYNTTKPGEFAERAKRYRNNLMSIRPEPFAKIAIESGNS